MVKISKLLITGIMGVVLSIGFSGCAKSQKEIRIEKKQQQKVLLEKEKREQIKKEKLKKEQQKVLLEKKKREQQKVLLEKKKREQLKKEHNLKLEEAKIYLNLANDNNKIYDLFDKINSKFKKTIYETDKDYKNRIQQLKNKYFNKKFIFDYKPQYSRYAAEQQTLLLSLTPFYQTSNIKLEEKFIGTKIRNGYTFNQKRNLLTRVPSSFTKGYKENGYGKELIDLYTTIKENCPPKEAKQIESNWKIRFVSNIDFNGLKLEGGWADVGDYNDNVVNTTMIIVYNKITNKIYKVIY